MQERLPGELRYFTRRLGADITELEIVPTGDVHYGNPMCSLRHYERHVKAIGERPNRYTILMGDLCEAALKDSKGDVYHQPKTPQEQRDFFIRTLTPIKDKILGMVTGNHEGRIAERCGIDISRDIAEALKVPYRPEGIGLRVYVGSGNCGHPEKPFVYDIYATHGYGGARTPGGKNAKLERTSTYVHAWVYFMAHDHVVNVAPGVYLMPDGRTKCGEDGWETGVYTAHKKRLIKTNSFLKWGGYGEALGFAPADLDDAPIAKLWGTEPKVRVES